MHFGVPVVPEEYMIKRGWLKGTCSKFSSDPPNPEMKSSNITLPGEISVGGGRGELGGRGLPVGDPCGVNSPRPTEGEDDDLLQLWETCHHLPQLV